MNKSLKRKYKKWKEQHKAEVTILEVIIVEMSNQNMDQGMVNR